MRDLLNGLYVRHTGQAPERVGERRSRRAGWGGASVLRTGQACHGAGACAAASGSSPVPLPPARRGSAGARPS